MKKYLSIFLSLVIAIALISWGNTGHHTIGLIAENHLNPKAQAAVRELLGDQSLADVASWADEVRNDPQYRNTASWHFLNLPLGLTYDQFQLGVTGMTKDNIYKALTQCEQDLIYKGTPREKKIEDLKFIVHFVGDLHQPMHISRGEDKGGNTIQLNYEGKGTNLHSLWDTKMLEHEGLSSQQLAEKYDHISATQIKQWQSDPLLKWIWESYEVSSKLYSEVDAMKGRTIDNAYYEAHIGIIRDRIEKAGIRLAGVLNEIFKDGPVNGAMIPPPPMAVQEPDVAKQIQKICDKVYTIKVLDGSQMTLINLGGAYPNQKLTIMINGRDRSKFPVAPEEAFKDKNICVTGKVIQYKGKPEIVIDDPSQITIEN